MLRDFLIALMDLSEKIKCHVIAVIYPYNSFGQTVKEIKNISGQTVVLSRDNLPSGLYFVRLTEDSKTLSVDKLVITE